MPLLTDFTVQVPEKETKTTTAAELATGLTFEVLDNRQSDLSAVPPEIVESLTDLLTDMQTAPAHGNNSTDQLHSTYRILKE